MHSTLPAAYSCTTNTSSNQCHLKLIGLLLVPSSYLRCKFNVQSYDIQVWTMRLLPVTV